MMDKPKIAYTGPDEGAEDDIQAFLDYLKKKDEEKPPRPITKKEVPHANSP